MTSLILFLKSKCEVQSVVALAFGILAVLTVLAPS